MAQPLRSKPPATVALTLRRFAVQLREHGYTGEALQRTVGIDSLDDVGLLNHAPALLRVADQRSPVATLIRLFFLEADESQRRATRALSPAMCAHLTAMGVLRHRGDQMRARLRVDPVGEQLFVSDLRFRVSDRGALRLPAGDPVYPPSSDSLLLRDAIVAPSNGSVLDLCTGSGMQAVQRAAGATQVVAVDINPRAAAVARLNARLNEVTNCEVRVGDLYAPVRGEQFDLIVANPPFVASPYETHAPSYHAGGPTGDRVLRRIVAGFTQHLRPAGRAFAISHVALRAGEEMRTVAARWFRHFAGRAVVLLLETGTPVDLAAAQALFALAGGLRAYAAEVRRWVAYLQRHRIATVALLLIAAERGERRGLDIIEARQRVLPIPLSAPPATRIAAWFGDGASDTPA